MTVLSWWIKLPDSQPTADGSGDCGPFRTISMGLSSASARWLSSRSRPTRPFLVWL